MEERVLKLEILKAILAHGSEQDRRDPLPKATTFFEWIVQDKLPKAPPAPGPSKNPNNPGQGKKAP